MPLYVITYRTGNDEEIEAATVKDNGEWMDFLDGSGLELLLRVRSADVRRVEVARQGHEPRSPEG